jgi:NADH:ubiquinone oxidoreductase subunit E
MLSERKVFVIMSEKTKITICMGSSCFARGNKENLALIEKFIAMHLLENEVELVGSLCEGKCSQGPNIIIDKRVYSNIDEAALIDALNRTFAEKIKPGGKK